MTINSERAGPDVATTAVGSVVYNPRDTGQAMLRGLRHTCPQCGKGALFSAYLKVNDTCPRCAEALHHQRADDAPPYFTIFIVGHIVLGGLLMMEKAFKPEPWQHAIVWLPLTVVLSLILLPRIKGLMVGLQWALRMHGFGEADERSTEKHAPLSAGIEPRQVPVS